MLLVTPDPIIRNQASACLLEHDYCLLTANDLSKASTLTHFHMPDLILLDGATGSETHLASTPQSAPNWIAWLRSSLETALIPVVLLTEQGPAGVKDLDSGANSYLLKPLEERRLLERVASTLERNPRMTAPPKLADRPTQRSSRSAFQGVPRLFTDPLRRALASVYDQDHPRALQQVNQLAGLAVQYVFSVTAAALKAVGSLETLPSWDKADSDQVVQEKLIMLPSLVGKLTELAFDETSLVELSELASYTVKHSGELVAPGKESSLLKNRLEVVSLWLAKAQNFFEGAVHLLHGPNQNGEIFGVIRVGSLSLQLDEPHLYLYLEGQPSPQLDRVDSK